MSPRTAVCFLELLPGRGERAREPLQEQVCEALGSPGGRPVAGRNATLESGRDGGGQDEHERRVSARRGGGEDLLPLEELIRQTPGAHPIGSAGELRCNAFETGQELQEFLAFISQARHADVA